MRRNNRPYVKIEHGVVVDLAVLEHLHANQLRVVVEKKNPYPIIVDENGALQDHLHRFTFGFVHGFEKLQDESYVVHHRRPNPRNNRVENLELRLRADHVRVHRLIRKRKSEKFDVIGFWRAHEKVPEKLVDPDAPLADRKDGKTAREVYVAPTLWPERGTGLASLAKQMRDAEEILDLAFDALDAVTRELDSGAPIAMRKSSGSSIDEASRAVGIEPIRLGCWRSEAALVRLLARHERADGTFDFDAAGAEVDIDPALFRHFLKRPAVAVAVERWRLHRRLPKPCPPGWPRRRAVAVTR